MERLTCPCCLDRSPSLETRLDIKSRPYMVCTSCSARLFIRGAQSLVGLAMLNPLAAALAEQIVSDRATWDLLQTTRRRVEASLRPTVLEPATTTTAEALAAAAGATR